MLYIHICSILYKIKKRMEKIKKLKKMNSMQKYLEDLKEYYPDVSEQENLFLSDFPLNTKEEWYQEIYKVLEKFKKPKDISSISWKTLDDLNILPFYRREDLEHLGFINEYPSVYPYTRGKILSQNWEILQYIQGSKKEILEKLEQTTRRGAEGVIIPYGDKSFPYTFYGMSVQNFDDLKDLLKRNKEYKFNSYIVGSSHNLFDLLNKQFYDSTIMFDPFLDYLLEGKYTFNFDDFIKNIEKEYKNYQKPFISIRGDVFQNAGLPPAMELGITLSSFAEILTHLQSLDLVSILPKISLVQATGSFYFLEIAKLRATRRLIAMILKAFSIEDYKESPKQIAVNSLFHHSIYDIYNNMLRNTISSMGAIIGGVDSIVILPISAVNNTDDEFTRRMAINTQLILKHESHLDFVTDPAGGSYYIENVTDQMAEKAWKVFLEIEEQGGFKKAMESGWLLNLIKNMQKIRIEHSKSRKEFLLGVNQFPNPKDWIIESYKEINLIGHYDEQSPNLQVFRSPIFFETLRIKTEQLSEKKGTPVFQLIPFGNLAMQRARASFIINFFGCGGFKVEDPGDLKSKERILEFLKTLNPQTISAFVLCSSDAEYLEMFKEIRDHLKQFQKPILIAGLPETKDELKSLEIFDFIHIKSNLYETLEKYQKLFLEN